MASDLEEDVLAPQLQPKTFSGEGSAADQPLCQAKKRATGFAGLWKVLCMFLQ